MKAMTAAMNEPFVNNEPFEVTPHKLLSSLHKADWLGADILAEIGDAAFRQTHTQ